MAELSRRDPARLQPWLLMLGLLLLFGFGVLVSALQQPAVQTIYWVRDDATAATLVAAPRRLRGEESEGLVRSLVAALAAGPVASERQLGLANELPAATEVLAVSDEAGVLVVDLSSAVMAGGGSHSQIGRLLQLLYSLSELPGVEVVSLSVEGVPAPVWGGEGVMVPERWVRPAGDLPRW
jgi:spore germination protein GerM